MRKISQGSGISITLENKTIEKRANWSSQLIQSYFFLRNSTYEKRTNEKWNSFRSIKRKNPIEDEVELIDSCSRSGREIRNKRSAETGLWEIYSPRPVEVNAGTNGRRDRGGNRPWNGRWSRCALSYAKHWPPWSDCIHRFNTYTRGGRETGSKILASYSLASGSPAPVSFSRASGPIRLFLEYPTKWGQVLRRICGIDGNPTYLREDGISTRG